MLSPLLKLAALSVLATLIGCAATERHRTVAPKTVATFETEYSGPKYVIVVGKFQNRSTYMQGLFSDDQDRLGNQAKTVLKTHLQQSNRFRLVDRQNMEDLVRESAIRGEKQRLKGARYTIAGSVTEFGRRETGDKQLYGIIGSGKSQVAYAKVMLNVIDVNTSEIIYSSQGAGEYALTSRQALGFGSKAGYDSTLNGKVLDLAVREAVQNLVIGLEQGDWTIDSTQQWPTIRNTF